MVSPSKPIEQANDPCHHTDITPGSRTTFVATRAIDKLSDGRRSGPDKSSRLPAKLARGAKKRVRRRIDERPGSLHTALNVR